MGKFDNDNRDCVVDAVQEHYGVKLDKVGQRPKWLRDDPPTYSCQPVFRKRPETVDITRNLNNMEGLPI